jgi:hypothetical protein
MSRNIITHIDWTDLPPWFSHKNRSACIKIDDIIKMEDELSLAQHIMSSLVKLYYDTVDNKFFWEYINLLYLFDDNIVYDRCELHIEWKTELTNFFIKRFKNLDITHTIQKIIPFKNKVIVIWSFQWTNKRLWKEISWNFVDIHEFDKNALEYKKWEKDIIFTPNDIDTFTKEHWKIKKRRTYLEDTTIKFYFPIFEMSLAWKNLPMFSIHNNDSCDLVKEFIKFSQNEIEIKQNFYNNRNNIWVVNYEKFIRMWYWFIIINIWEWWKETNEIHIIDLANKSSSMRHFSSNLWADIIK